MFSNLGPLFKTVFREAEPTDTRQAIRREEKEQGRKKQDDEADNRISIDLWEDSASVSVTSLQAFLVDFINDKKTNDKKVISKTESNHVQNDKAKPQNTFVAKATNAYQTMADKTAPAKEEPAQIQNISEADLIESEEMRKIYKLIEDLEELSAKGIESLYIEQAESFVDSLINAVRLQKSKL